ncbi:MAG: HAD family hydrolase [Clostridia bacterium]|nr:HAD family hydrolase [Clostridia bacterium]
MEMKNRNHYTHVVWDFNGTVLNDVRLGIDCVNAMLKKRGLPIIPDEDAYRKIFGFPIDDYYRRLGFNFEKEDYETVLAPEWVALYLAGEEFCPVVEGARDTIGEIKRRGISQIMLSATKLQQLEGQLRRLELNGVFDEVLGLDNIHARSKTFLAVEWKAKNPEARPLFVGDTEHDADVADAIGADCVLYFGGHQSKEILATRGKPMIGTIPELLEFL